MFQEQARSVWPETRPDFSPADWILDGGGKHLVLDRIPQDRPFRVLEIGVFLGSSVRQWLAKSPLVSVVALDPWQDDGFWPDYARKHGRFKLAEQFARPNGVYQTFLSSLWSDRDRVLPVRAASPEALYSIATTMTPDLVYLDNDKTGTDLAVAHELWPDAILTGDDWTWGDDNRYPIRGPVREFARANNYRVVASLSTWVLTPNQLTAADRRANVESQGRDIARALRRRVRVVARRLSR